MIQDFASYVLELLYNYLMAIVRMCQCSRRTVYYNEHLLHSHLKRAIMFEFMLALALSRLSLRIPHFTLSSQSVSIRSHAKRITFAIFRPDNCLAIECFWVTNSIERERKKNTQTNHSMLPIWCDVIHFAFFLLCFCSCPRSVIFREWLLLFVAALGAWCRDHSKINILGWCALALATVCSNCASLPLRKVIPSIHSYWS